MDNNPIDDKAFEPKIVVCPTCGARNRLHYQRKNGFFRCGSCKSRLSEPFKHTGMRSYRISSWRWHWPTFKISPGRIYALFIVFVFGLGNLLLVGGQKLAHRDDLARLDKLKAQIAIDKAHLVEQETALSQLSTQIENLAHRVETANSLAVQNATIENHNRLIDDYHSLFDEYSSHVEATNQIIKEANALSEKIGGTWFLIPIPFGRGVH